MSAFLQGLEASGWLKHIKAVIDTSAFIAEVQYSKLIYRLHTAFIAEVQYSKLIYRIHMKNTGVLSDINIACEYLGGIQKRRVYYASNVWSF
jgi:hypothetical protein